MCPSFSIGGFVCSMYALCIIGGLALGLGVALLLSRRRKVPAAEILYTVVFGAIGAVLGGKLLYLLVNLSPIIALYQTANGWTDVLQFTYALFSGGFVYYGGLFGGVAAACWYCRVFRQPAALLLPPVITVIPLIHACGRLGCFCAGCCYGVPYDGPLALTFSHSAFAPAGVALFPVQLLEALCNLLIFVVLLLAGRNGRRWQSLFALYLFLYAACRFALEYLRGDTVRGSWLIFSTSQWISLLIAVAVLLWLLLRRRQKV